MQSVTCFHDRSNTVTLGNTDANNLNEGQVPGRVKKRTSVEELDAHKKEDSSPNAKISAFIPFGKKRIVLPDIQNQFSAVGSNDAFASSSLNGRISRSTSASPLSSFLLGATEQREDPSSFPKTLPSPPFKGDYESELELSALERFPEDYREVVYSNGRIYKGCFYKNQPHGKGELFIPNEGSYFGDFFEGKLMGKGSWKYVNGDTYNGDVLDGKRQGSGKYVYQNGSLYVGSFENDKAHGQGRMVYLNGDSYEGDWVEGKRHGTGTFVEQRGAVYEGQYQNDLRHGYGTYIIPNRLNLRGMWYLDYFGKQPVEKV